MIFPTKESFDLTDVEIKENEIIGQICILCQKTANVIRKKKWICSCCGRNNEITNYNIFVLWGEPDFGPKKSKIDIVKKSGIEKSSTSSLKNDYDDKSLYPVHCNSNTHLPCHIHGVMKKEEFMLLPSKSKKLLPTNFNEKIEIFTHKNITMSANAHSIGFEKSERIKKLFFNYANSEMTIIFQEDFKKGQIEIIQIDFPIHQNHRDFLNWHQQIVGFINEVFSKKIIFKEMYVLIFNEIKKQLEWQSKIEKLIEWQSIEKLRHKKGEK